SAGRSVNRRADVWPDAGVEADSDSYRSPDPFHYVVDDRSRGADRASAAAAAQIGHAVSMQSSLRRKTTAPVHRTATRDGPRGAVDACERIDARAARTGTRAGAELSTTPPNPVHARKARS